MIELIKSNYKNQKIVQKEKNNEEKTFLISEIEF